MTKIDTVVAFDEKNIFEIVAENFDITLVRMFQNILEEKDHEIRREGLMVTCDAYGRRVDSVPHGYEKGETTLPFDVYYDIRRSI